MTEFPRPLTTTGTAPRHRRSVGDRQALARRLLFESVEDSYNSELDIHWDAPVDADKNWLPPRRISIAGTRLWQSLTDQQRRDLGRRELVNLLSFAVYVECALTMLLLRDVEEDQALVDDRARYALAAVKEQMRDATMFGRLIDKTGLPPYLRRAARLVLSRTVLLTPTGPAGRATVLLVEELLQQVWRELAAAPDLQPHVRQVMMLHLLAGDRHIRFARAEVARTMAERRTVVNHAHGVAVAAITAAAYPLLLNPAVYADAGIRPARGLLAAYLGGRYQDHARFLTGRFVGFGTATGLFDGPAARAVLRVGRVWPPTLSTRPSAPSPRSAS